MDPQETCGTCDHNISQLFLCDPVCIFFCICADHILDPVIVIIRKFILALCSLCNSVIINQSCKFPYSRIFENIRIYQWNILWQTHNSNLGCSKGRSAQLKEVVLNPYSFNSQCFLKNLTECSLSCCNRLYIAGSVRGYLRHWQCFFINLTARCHRHFLNADKERRHHIIRDQRLQEGLQFILRDGFSCIISCDIFISTLFNYCNGCIFHQLMFQKGTFDLTKLHTISSDLHLWIDPAYVLNISVTFHTDHITGPVKTAFLLTYSKWIFYKHRCCFFRKIMISSGNLPSCVTKFAGRTHRKPVQILIHNVAAHIPLWFSDRDVVILSVYQKLCGRNRILCRTVAINHLIGTVTVMLEFLAAKCNKFKSRCILQKFCNQFSHLGREGYGGDLFFLYISAYGNGVLTDTLR